VFDDAIARAITKMLVFLCKAVVFRKTLESVDLTRLKFRFVHYTGPKCKVHYVHVLSYEYNEVNRWNMNRNRHAVLVLGLNKTNKISDEMAKYELVAVS